MLFQWNSSSIYPPKCDGTGVDYWPPPRMLKTSLGGLVFTYWSKNRGSPLFLGTTSVSSFKNFSVSTTSIEWKDPLLYLSIMLERLDIKFERSLSMYGWSFSPSSALKSIMLRNLLSFLLYPVDSSRLDYSRSLVIDYAIYSSYVWTAYLFVEFSLLY